MEFTRDGKTVAFERVKAKDGAADTWKRVSPTPADADEGQDRIAPDRAWPTSAPSRSRRRETNTGLDSPVLTVVAKFDEGKKEERVTFRQEREATCYAATVDPGAAKIEASRLDEALKTLDELSK